MATLSHSSFLRKIFPTARQLLIEADLNHFIDPKAEKVLVIGAGLDPYRARFIGAQLYVSVDMVFYSGCTDIIADALALPFAEESFDCVVATEVAEHVRDPLKLIDEAYNVLSPGGKLFLSVPFGFHQHADPADYWRPTRWLLEESFLRFQFAKIMPQGNRMHVLSDLVSTAFSPHHLFFPLRIFNHLIVGRVKKSKRSTSTFPSGHFVVAIK